MTHVRHHMQPGERIEASAQALDSAGVAFVYRLKIESFGDKVTTHNGADMGLFFDRPEAAALVAALESAAGQIRRLAGLVDETIPETSEVAS